MPCCNCHGHSCDAQIHLHLLKCCDIAAGRDVLGGQSRNKPTETLNIPGNLDVNVTLESDPDGTALQTLVTSLNNDVTSGRSAAIETNSARFVGLRANGLVFDRTFIKPVAIAYDALAGSPDWFEKISAMRVGSNSEPKL